MAEALAPPRLITAQWRQMERLRRSIVAATARRWAAAGYQGDAIDDTVRLVLAGQIAVVAQTDAALSLAAGIATGTTTTPAGIDPGPLIGRAARHGVLLEEVYRRPVTVAREAGPARAATYLESVVRMDLQLAQRQAANAHVLADRRVIGWRRQTNPGGKTCGFCVAAATRRYGRGDLLPLHHMCRCTVVEIYSTDPIRGKIIDRERLDEVYRRSGGATDRATLGRIRFAPHELPPGVDSDAIAALNPRIVDHPELGPYLTGDRHDSEFDLAAA